MDCLAAGTELRRTENSANIAGIGRKGDGNEGILTKRMLKFYLRWTRIITEIKAADRKTDNLRDEKEKGVQ